MFDAECAICLEPLDGFRSTLPCSHAFHSACIIRACMRDARCPICRIGVIGEVVDAKAATHPTSVIEITLPEPSDQAAAARAHRNYQARRRRFIGRHAALARTDVRLHGALTEARALEGEMQRARQQAHRDFERSALMVELRRRARLAHRRVQRCQTELDARCAEALGAPPLPRVARNRHTRLIERLVDVVDDFANGAV